MSKKILIIGSSMFLIVIVAIVYWISPWIAIYTNMQKIPNPPRPEITHGEFPFRLEYEIDSQIFTVEDTLICDFDGFATNEARGKYRQWKSRMASGNTRIILLKTDDIEIFFTPGINSKKISAFYMGDSGTQDNKSTFPNAYYTKDFNDERENAYIISSDDLLSKYGIKLISWEPSPPIKNIFK